MHTAAFAWEPDKGTHIGVMPRNGSVEDMRWFETDPCYVFHPMNAYEDGNRIVLDLMRDPNIGKNPLVRRAVSLLTSFVTLHGVETDQKHVDIAFRALPTGLGGAVRSVRNNVVLPSMSRLLPRAR